MKCLVKFLLVFGLLIVGVKALWDWWVPVRTLNYRLDVTFEVNGQPVTGSGVQQLVVSRAIPLLGQKQATWRASGQAVPVDLPNGKTVYVLMASPRDDGSYPGGSGRFNLLVSDACKLQDKRGGRDWASYVKFVGDTRGTCNIQINHVPLMVVFLDEAKPATAVRVYPRNPAETLGVGVRFIGASLTITDASITTGIEERLAWLENYDSKLLGGKGSLSSLAYIYIRRDPN